MWVVFHDRTAAVAHAVDPAGILAAFVVHPRKHASHRRTRASLDPAGRVSTVCVRCEAADLSSSPQRCC